MGRIDDQLRVVNGFIQVAIGSKVLDQIDRMNWEVIIDVINYQTDNLL